MVDVPDSFEAPALGDRILSLDKEKVAQFASAMMRGFLKSEIIGVAKHFPGHGKANVDSHLELPECDASLEELRDLDLVPFRKVIRSKAAGIMSAHISFPKIDREFASSLSQKIIQNLLRNELRYNGLLFSDDMEMGAIVENYSLSDACLQAIMVGTDHVLVCHDLETVLEIKNDILAKLQSGMISLETIKISLDRIIEYKNKFATIETLDFSEVEKIIGCEEHLAIADSIG